jgi:tetraacyldisaccharide 4'-kinase
MIDKILLFPYWLSLKIRHFLYDKGIKKVHQADVPTICIGNVTVGGTGKTPHSEMLLRTMLADSALGRKSIAVLSRGYKRKTKGFQQVTAGGRARDYGDEPLQIKRKFPMVTVAVDSSRIRGCDFLVHPEKLQTEKSARKCKDKNFLPAELIILDDAYQHRKLKPTVSIVLIDFNRPTFRDHLLPLGRLRDLPERVHKADILIVTKCPYDLNSWQKCTWADNLGLKDFNAQECCGIRPDGQKQHLFFTQTIYDNPEPVFPEGEARYIYTKRLILFSGIANDTPLTKWLSRDYKIARRLRWFRTYMFY